MFEREFPYLRKLCLKLETKFSRTHRLVNCIEELSELQKQLCKILRWDMLPADSFSYSIDIFYDFNILRVKVIEEMADTYLTIEESKYILHISDEEIYKEMQKKINRGVR
jgi:TRAP-type mannitol/chloroaromatic compound transport system substrate-binding protein